MIPTGPFFDQWGRDIAQGLALPDGTPSEETYEVVAALRHGWERLPKTVGYGRALQGILEVHPNLPLDDLTQVPNVRLVLKTSQKDFEKKWNELALEQMDDIPSRAV